MVQRNMAAYLEKLLPGLDWQGHQCDDLMEQVIAAAENGSGIFVLHLDEVPVGEDLQHVLADGFGAEAGDRVIEIDLNGKKPVRAWRLGEAA
jgi:hypothetical protein